jgi:ankyrin repeat protein
LNPKSVTKSNILKILFRPVIVSETMNNQLNMLMPAIIVAAVIFGGVMWVIPSIIIAAVILGGINLIKRREMKHNKLIAIVAVLLVGGWFLFGSSPIHEGALMGNIETVKQAIAAGADVNEKDKLGLTPLHSAATEGHKEIAELLIVEGADVNVKDKFGFTPLHDAAEEGQKEIVKLLITKGADVNAQKNNGWTPLDLAISDKHPETADLLRKHGGKTGDWLDADKSIHKAARAGHIEAVKQHLAAGADVELKCVNCGGTVLGHAVSGLGHAVSGGHIEIVELLISKSADVNAKDDDGDTPLDGAIYFGKTQATELLRKHGGKTGEELKAAGN